MEEFLPRTQIIRPLDDDLVSTQSIGLLDNQVTITITRDGEALAKRVFTKALFAGQPEVASAKNLVLGGIAFSSVDERGFHFGAQLNLPGDDEGGLIYKLTLPLSAQGNPAIERDTNQDTSASDEVSD